MFAQQVNDSNITERDIMVRDAIHKNVIFPKWFVMDKLAGMMLYACL